MPDDAVLGPIEDETVFVLLDLRGHSSIPATQVHRVRNAAQHLVDTCAALGLELKGGFMPSSEAIVSPKATRGMRL